VLNKLQWPARVPLALRPTPLQFLERASDHWGRGKRLWMKRDDLTGSLLTGNKVRKLEFICAIAQEQGVDTLITCGGLQSNHARATAAVCAQMGWHCHLILRGEQATFEGNTFLDCLLGAQIEVVPEKDYQQTLEHRLEERADTYRNAGRKPLIIPTGGSNGLGIWGYLWATLELLEDCEAAGINRAAVITATGSGGTQAGLTYGADIAAASMQVIGVAVCDDKQYFHNKVLSDVEDARKQWPSLPPLSRAPTTWDDFIGPGYGVGYDGVYRCMRDLARIEGIVLDPVYTGKAFYGMTEAIKDGRLDDQSDIVFMHTGGIFGAFSHHEVLAPYLDAQLNHQQQ